MSNKETVQVTIDANEAAQNPDLTEILVLHEDVEDYYIEPLSEGDIIIEDCMFERKTPSDFASSLQEGRLRDQVERMAGSEKRPWILVEGNMEDFENLGHTDIPPKSLRGMDASIEAKNNIGVKYCSNAETLADMAVRLARKQKESVNVTEARQTDAIKDVNFLESVFLSVEGIGVKTAENLAGRFNGLQEVINASREDFQTVEGVGEKTSEDIYTAIHKDYGEGTERSTTEKQKKVYNI